MSELTHDVPISSTYRLTTALLSREYHRLLVAPQRLFRKRFAGNLNDLTVPIRCRVADRWFDLAEQPNFKQAAFEGLLTRLAPRLVNPPAVRQGSLGEASVRRRTAHVFPR